MVRAMKILITGNLGYVGSILVPYLRLRHPESEIIGYDTGYFAHCFSNATRSPEVSLTKQAFGDIRDFPDELLNGIDAVVHLAAISNDPMGKEFEGVTHDINKASSIRMIEASAKAGVRNFVFASSCSMYGATGDGMRKEDDPTNPLTAYAKSKIGTEQGAKELDLGDMNFTSLRFATACGMSPRLRLDLVLNDFVASAMFLGEITVLSDGTPWRPLIDVSDMARAIDWALTRNANNGGQWVAVNAGSSQSNYQVKQLAEAVQDVVKGTSVSINTSAAKDERSYSVDFSKFESLASDHLPQMSLQDSIQALASGIQGLSITANFRQKQFIRLVELRQMRAQKLLNNELFWA